ncbi:hypothetical protein MTX26_27400 [Bradyrhizobium sp. ISRA443]|uniref:hypothetical protein n=1 Tax=Bradyrhizobium sp. ISRA443 TaxID=2866198 RepID=UPI0024790626|nr:hypothetical protein [Bradyrhizobium sp. ISRA443]WGS11775.1 hypothetical protein MTX26_27400 [Bradyrhizobium sp. ISRA443]
MATILRVQTAPTAAQTVRMTMENPLATFNPVFATSDTTRHQWPKDGSSLVMRAFRPQEFARQPAALASASLEATSLTPTTA